MARTLASAWVHVSPTGFPQFAKSAQAGIKTALKGVSATVPVQANTRPATLSIDDLKARLAEFARTVAAARLDADDKEAVAKLAAMGVKLDALGRRVASPRVTVEGLAKAEAELLGLDVAFDRLGKKAENLGGGAVSAGRDLGALSQFAMPALIGAGVALSPVLVTTGVGLAGLGAAASKTIAPILAAGTATTAQQKALASLDGNQLAAYASLGKLKGQFSGFAKALEPETIGLFDTGLGLARDLLHDVSPVAASAGKGLDSVVGALAADLHSQQWQSFFAWMAQNAGPDIQLVGQAFISLLNTLPQLLTQLQPVAVEMLTLVTDAGKLITITDQLATKTDNLGRSASSSGGWLGRLSDAAKKAFLQMFPGVKAAGQLKTALDGQAKNAAKAGDATKKLAAAQAQAQPSTTNLATDVSILGSATATAANQATALTDAWGILVGSFSGHETAVLNARGAVKAFGDAITQSGAGSLAARQAFESAVTAIGAITTADAASHAPAKQVYNDILAQYNALRQKGPLNESERRQLDGIRKFLDITAASTDGWTAATRTAAGAIGKSLLPQLAQMHVDTPKVRGDVDNLTNSIINTGTKSTATHDARDKLRQDLINAGLSAKAAKTLVDSLQTSINNMHGKNVNVGVTGTGGGGVVITGTGTAAGQGNVRFTSLAGGGLVRYGSGPVADDVPAMLSRGELVVPAGMVAAGAVDHLRGRLPGFAAGGLAGLAGGLPGVPGAVAGFAERDAAAGMAAGVRAALAAAKATVTKNASFAVPGGGGGPVRALMQRMAAAIGWTGAEWNALDYVETREAGYQLTARNPSSGAYGLAQFINGPSEYFQYGGSPFSAVGQITGFFNYIRQRYGDPIAAANHERAFNWYAKGGLVGMAAGGAAGWLGRLRTAQGAELHDYLGLAAAFKRGPAKYRTKTVISELATLARVQAAEEAAYDNVLHHGTGAANLAKLAARLRAVRSTAGDKGLSRLPGGHPGYAAGLRFRASALLGLESSAPAFAGSQPKLAQAAWMSRFKAAQRLEYRDYLGLRGAFLSGPRKYRTKAVLSALAALKARQSAEEAGYDNIIHHGTTGPNLAKEAGRVAAELTATRAGVLSRLPGGHPGFVRGVQHHLRDLAALLAAQPYNSPWNPSGFGPSHTALGGVERFDKGGYLKPGLTWAFNGTGRPEPVGGAQPIEVTLSWDMSRLPPGLDPRTLKAIRYEVRTKGGGSVERAFGGG